MAKPGIIKIKWGFVLSDSCFRAQNPIKRGFIAQSYINRCINIVVIRYRFLSDVMSD